MSPSPCSFMTALDKSFALVVSLPVISCSTSTSLLFSQVRNPFLTTLTHLSPFMLDTRQNPWLEMEPLRESHLEMLNDFTSRMDAAMKEACSSLTNAAHYMAQFYDTHHKEVELYAVRDKVWLNGRKITTT